MWPEHWRRQSRTLSPADLTLTEAGAEAPAFLIRAENRNTSAVRSVRLRVPLQRAGWPPATHAKEEPALRLCAASARNGWRPKWAGGPRGRKVCGIKGCNHPVPHRPATRAGDAVLKGFQPLFRIFLEGAMLSLFWRCYQICYQAGGKCRSSSGFHGFKCAITPNFAKWRLF